MKIKTLNRALCFGIAAALALPIAGTAVAQETLNTIEVNAVEVNAVPLLSRATGLTERQVQMVLGNRTSYAGYVASYDFVDRRLQQAIGPEMYQHLKQHGELTARHVQDLTAMANARTNAELASK